MPLFLESILGGSGQRRGLRLAVPYVDLDTTATTKKCLCSNDEFLDFMTLKERTGRQRKYRYMIKAMKSRVTERPHIFIGVSASFTVQLVTCKICVMTAVDIVMG